MSDDAMTPETASAPQLSRPVKVNFRGDWGQANMHRICGWLAQEVGDRSPEGSQFAIWSGRGGADSIDALRNGDADIAVITPSVAARVFYEGNAPGHQAQPDLRCLGVLGHDDRLVVAVDASLGVETISDLSNFAMELRIATSPDDGVNLIGMAAHALLRFSGVDPEVVRRAGGSLIYDERPFPCIEAFRAGIANVLIQEAVMAPSWQNLDQNRPVKYLSIDSEATAAFSDWNWPTATLPPGYFTGQEEELTTLDFSDFAVLCRADLPEELAELVAWCMVATRGSIEMQYAVINLPAKHIPFTVPVSFEKLTSAPIPLHPGAARVYEKVGDIRDSGSFLGSFIRPGQ